MSVHERRFVPKDTLIIEEGETGHSAYLLLSGFVEVYVEHMGKKTVLAKLGAGQIFGEMALVFDEKRTASVRALENCNVIVITRDALKAKIEKSDPTVKALVEMLSRRVVSSNHTLVQKQNDMEDLIDTTNTVYQNVLNALPNSQKKAFQKAVFPKLDDFLTTIRAFKDRYS